MLVLTILANVALIQDWSWAARFTQALQLDGTTLAISVDLGVLWLFILGPHFKDIMSWLETFTGEGRRQFSRCPSCGFQAEESNAAKMLKERLAAQPR